MQTNQFLNEILQMLRSFRDDRKKLEKLHQYMQEELYEEPEDEGPGIEDIPEKYRSLISEIADSLNAGLVCYLNPHTLEKEEIPASILENLMFNMDEIDEELYGENPFYEVLKRIEQEWKGYITISPPESHRSFEFMEGFIQHIQNSGLQKRLSAALSRRKPFRNFKTIIDESTERKNWFTYKQKCLERYTIEQLAGSVPGIEF